MVYFKYYRKNYYFEKSLRYDEIYFSSNEELNDPLDLILTPCFSDNKDAWRKILQLTPTVKTWNLTHFLNTTCEELASDLNSIFKGSTLKSPETIKSLVEAKSKDLELILTKHISRSADSQSVLNSQSPFKNDDIDTNAKRCVHFLAEILSRGWSKTFYSCSFSKSALAPMMWAHYADGFKGCVIIYSSKNPSTIGLKPYIYSNSYEDFNFLEINYSDNDKKVCILEHILGGDGVNAALLEKSSFWSYEKEFRLLLAEDFGSIRLTLTTDMPKSSRTRIFHHEPEAIIGVIFGAKCPTAYIQYIKSILVEKYSYIQSKLSGFYSFETELTFDGRVVIKSGSLCSSKGMGSNQVLEQIFEGERLAKVLYKLGITNSG